MLYQLSMADYLDNFTYTRNGSLIESFCKLRPERCECCRYFDLLPVDDQAPVGWLVKGLCSCHHDYGMEKGYWTVSTNSYCIDFERKFNEE